MNEKVTQPESKLTVEPTTTPSLTTTRPAQANGGAESIRRRDIAAILGGALGMFALTKCGGEPQTSDSAQNPEQIGRLSQGLSGSDIKWVNTTLGAALTQTWTGDLATRYGPADSGQFSLGANVVIAEGCIKPNDGGGGVFYWVTGTPPPVNGMNTGDGGTTIVPSHQPVQAGYWQRIISEPVSVRWFGATGDGSTDDTAAIQRAIDLVAMNFINPSSLYVSTDCTGSYPYSIGNDVVVPPGSYVLAAPSGGAALWIATNNVKLVGTGGAPYGPLFILTGSGSGIVIEAGGSANGQLPDDGGTCFTYYPNSGPIARGAEIRNITINSITRTNLDGIVVHAPNVAIYDTSVTNMQRHGILIEAGSTATILGATRAPSGTSFIVDFWRLTNVEMAACGDTTSNGDPTRGTAVYVWSNNANGGVANGLHAISCNVGFYDASFGDTWIGCYSEGGQLGYKDVSSLGATWVQCFSEDVTNGSFQNGLTLNGSVSQAGRQGAPQRIGFGVSQLSFGTIGSDAALYGANVPGAHSSGIDLSRGYVIWSPNRAYQIGDLVVPTSSNGFYYKCTAGGTSGGTQPAFPASATCGSIPDGGVTWTCAGPWAGTSVWALAYQPTTAWPFLQQSWRWSHYTNGTQDLDVNGGPFGWTEPGAPRGGGLALVASPLLNTLRRWTWKQAQDVLGRNITLFPGPNVIYLNGYYLDVSNGIPTDSTMIDHGAMTFADTGSDVWPGPPSPQWRVSVEIEFPSVTALTGADVRIVGYTFIPYGSHQGNIAVKIVNAGTSAVTATVVWHFELFQTNYDAQAGLG